jgi:hypothetical protein
MGKAAVESTSESIEGSGSHVRRSLHSVSFVSSFDGESFETLIRLVHKSNGKL